MSDFHKPTATFPDGVYNATQVRLYGLAATRFGAKVSVVDKPTTLNAGGVEITLAPRRRQHDDQKQVEEMEGKLKDMDPLDIESWPMPLPPVPISYSILIPIDMKGLGKAFLGTTVEILPPQSLITPGIIYGYAYEGHCYDLPKPKIMLIPSGPRRIPPDDCGYNSKQPAGYRLWIVDKLDQCVEIEVNQGFVEQLVLEANLPGRRSPSTYRATMALSHRSGRLTE